MSTTAAAVVVLHVPTQFGVGLVLPWMTLARNMLSFCFVWSVEVLYSKYVRTRVTPYYPATMRYNMYVSAWNLVSCQTGRPVGSGGYSGAFGIWGYGTLLLDDGGVKR